MRRVAVVAFAIAATACSPSSDPSDSLLRIEEEMCGASAVATGVAVSPDLVLTNAHNVVGSDGTLSVFQADGTELAGVVTAIDIHRDLALLWTDGLTAPPIRRSPARESTTGEILRLDESLAPVRVTFTGSDLVTARGHDIYDAESDVPRATVRAQANVGPGWSGAPMIDDDGAMVGVVWAESRTTGFTYAVAASEVEAFIDGAPTTPIATTGPCAP